MFFWNTKKVRKTNLKMATKVTVVDDRSEPTILMNLNDGRDLEVWKKGRVFFVLMENCSDTLWKSDGA